MISYYALNSVEEAIRYLYHLKLRKQLLESAYALFSCKHQTVDEIMRGNTTETIDHIAVCTIDFAVHSASELDSAIKSISVIKSVDEVHRVDIE